MWTKLEMMICRRNSELFKIHSQTLHHKLPLSHFQPHRRITLCPSPLFQFNSSKPIYNYESFLNRKLEFFTWAHFISQLLVWGNWLVERMITINNRVSNSAQKLVNITRPDIHRWLMKEFSISTMNHQKARVFGIILNISGTQGWSIFIWTICLKDTWLSF